MDMISFKTKAERLVSNYTSGGDALPMEKMQDENFSKNSVFLFVAKGLICMGLLFVFSLVAPGRTLPSWAIALIWMILAIFISLGVAYASVIRKTHRQVKYQPGGQLERLNIGRTVCLLIAFVVGAFFALSLIIEVPKWDAFEWALAIISIPLFLVVAFVVRQRVDKNYKPPFRTWGIICWSSVIAALILCAIYVVVLIATSETSYDSALQAFIEVEDNAPYKNSNSVLISSFGQVSALADGFTQYAITKSSADNLWIGVIWRLIIGASSFFAIANLLSICWMKPAEIKRIFQPLEDLTVSEHQAKKQIKGAYVFTLACYAALFWCLFFGLDYHAASFADSWLVSQTRDAIQDQLSKSVCIIDGKYYDQQVVLETVEGKVVEAKKINSEARAALIPLIDDSFDKRRDNVENYLDWLFQDVPLLPLEYNHQLRADDSSQITFNGYLEAGINDSQLYREIEDYSKKAKDIKPQLMAELSEKELQNNSGWLLSGANSINNNELDLPSNVVSGLLNATNDSSYIPISIPYPIHDFSFGRDECKKQIEDTISSERDRYLSIVGGR